MEFSHNSFPFLHPHPSFLRICGLLGSPGVTESVEVMIMTSCKSVLESQCFWDLIAIILGLLILLWLEFLPIIQVIIYCKFPNPQILQEGFLVMLRIANYFLPSHRLLSPLTLPQLGPNLLARSLSCCLYTGHKLLEDKLFIW